MGKARKDLSQTAYDRVVRKLLNGEKLSKTDYGFMLINTERFMDFKFVKRREVKW